MFTPKVDFMIGVVAAFLVVGFSGYCYLDARWSKTTIDHMQDTLDARVR